MGVVRCARRRGLGRLLLTEEVRRFQTLGASEVWPDVNVNNPAVAALYAGLGFETVGVRARYAPSPKPASGLPSKR